jgi:hypothetical protein
MTPLAAQLRAGLFRCDRCGSADLAVLNDVEPYLDPDRCHVRCNKCNSAGAARLARPAVTDPFAPTSEGARP